MQAIRIRDLVEKFDQELVRFKNYRVFWKQLIAYFERQQEHDFSEQTALAFLEERYHPPVVVFLIFRKFFQRGLAIGSVKG